MSAGVKVSEPGMEGSVKNEEVFEAAKKMMGREFQTVLAALLKILPDYEDMLVKFINDNSSLIVTLTIALINLIRVLLQLMRDKCIRFRFLT